MANPIQYLPIYKFPAHHIETFGALANIPTLYGLPSRSPKRNRIRYCYNFSLIALLLHIEHLLLCIVGSLRCTARKLKDLRLLHGLRYKE